MGEANLRFVRGDRETAIRMCMEVIRQDPTAPEPYQTLSNVYEEGGEQEKSLQFALIAAHLSPQDPEEWARLADMSLEMGDRNQAISCYRKGMCLYRQNVINYNVPIDPFVKSHRCGSGKYSLSSGKMHFIGTKWRNSISHSRIQAIDCR